MTDSVGDGVVEDGKFSWYLPNRSCDLPTGFVVVNGQGVLRFEAGEGWDKAIEKGRERMRMQDQQGQTGIALLALIVALVALGVAIYTFLQTIPREDLHTQLNKVQELIEQGRQETADTLKRLEEQVRGSQPQESSPKQ